MLHLRTTLQTIAASRLHWRAGSLGSFAAIRKEAGLCCDPKGGRALLRSERKQGFAAIRKEAGLCCDPKGSRALLLSERKQDFPNYPEAALFGKAYLLYRGAPLRNLPRGSEGYSEVASGYTRGRVGYHWVLSTHEAS